MVSSGKNLSAAMLLIFLVTAVLFSMPTCTQGECKQYGNGWCECRHLSGTYSGPCFDDDDDCNETCLNEDSTNIYGECDDNYQCSCYTKCSSLFSKTGAVASAPIQP
ncbi:hypothetical protein SORBI_3004G075550 [Sorghum bicolor]|uniref:Knottins-like domain-containing protein n=1 Tax=Sorghum bicolor TaxID=4558 RepID=A0A1Z5RLV1_SORBI|nr:hypothetical protein SORBI_3004G075550 [Sorghum bicolor]